LDSNEHKKTKCEQVVLSQLDKENFKFKEDMKSIHESLNLVNEMEKNDIKGLENVIKSINYI
jgi:hypothetical protein